MSLTQLALAVWFALFAVNALAWVAVSATALGVVALIVAILLVVEGLGYNTSTKR